jgi:hypothetical protein
MDRIEICSPILFSASFALENRVHNFLENAESRFEDILFGLQELRIRKREEEPAAGGAAHDMIIAHISGI